MCANAGEKKEVHQNKNSDNRMAWLWFAVPFFRTVLAGIIFLKTARMFQAVFCVNIKLYTY